MKQITERPGSRYSADLAACLWGPFAVTVAFIGLGWLAVHAAVWTWRHPLALAVPVFLLAWHLIARAQRRHENRMIARRAALKASGNDLRAHAVLEHPELAPACPWVPSSPGWQDMEWYSPRDREVERQLAQMKAEMGV